MRRRQSGFGAPAFRSCTADRSATAEGGSEQGAGVTDSWFRLRRKPKGKNGAEVVPARRATSAGGTATGEARRRADVVKPHRRG